MFTYPYRQSSAARIEATPQLTPETARSLEIATVRTAAVMQAGRLLSSLEARLMAGPEARERETLYSIAQSTAFELGGDPEEVLAALERRFRSWR